MTLRAGYGNLCEGLVEGPKHYILPRIGGREIECIMQKGNNIYSIETNGSVRGLSTMMVTTMSPWRVSGLKFTRQLDSTSTWSVPCGDISWRWGLVFIELDWSSCIYWQLKWLHFKLRQTKAVSTLVGHQLFSQRSEKNYVHQLSINITTI